LAWGGNPDRIRSVFTAKAAVLATSSTSPLGTLYQYRFHRFWRFYFFDGLRRCGAKRNYFMCNVYHFVFWLLARGCVYIILSGTQIKQIFY
jgi:hypothetical protein